MKRTRKKYILLILICLVSVVIACSRFKTVKEEEFINLIYKVYGEELEFKQCIGGYKEATDTIHGADGTSDSSLIYRIYDDEEDARVRFEEYCEDFDEINENNPDSVEIVIVSEDRGYIIYDDVIRIESYSEFSDFVNGELQTVCFDTSYSARRFGCIYYYDSTIIVINEVETIGTQNIDKAIELLDELGLPHM